MLTYQDLTALGEAVAARGEFIEQAINEHRKSAAYRAAADAEAYYHKHVLTIDNFVKWLYTVTGRRIEDVFGANYKLPSHFFRRIVIQGVSYVLGNGVFLDKPGAKEKLGPHFDQRMVELFKAASVGGRAYGFWNLDHLEVFHFADTVYHPGFVPLYNEDTAELCAGIRYWYRTIGNSDVLFATLYEVDGISDWRKGGEKYTDMTELTHRTAYVTKTYRSEVETSSTPVAVKELPIIEAVANDGRESELVGLRQKIDCYCLIESGFANDVDEASSWYWVIQNAGGMNDRDLAQFIQRMKTAHAAVVDGDDGAKAEAHTMDVPVEAREKILDRLRRGIYEDAQLLDVREIAAGSKTATEIRAAYQAQDDKAADLEMHILEFLEKLLPMAGVDAVPSLRWNKILNETEETNMILAASEYLDDETIIRKLPFLTPEEAEAIIEKRAAEDIKRITGDEDEEDGDEGADA